MDLADIVQCSMLFNGVAGNNKFTCTSNTGSGYSIPTINAIKTVADISTNTLFDTNAQTVTAEATFSRELTTSDAKNLILIDGQTIYAIAAFGNVFTNSPNFHGNNYWTYRMRFFSVNMAQSQLFFGAMAMIAAFSSYLLL